MYDFVKNTKKTQLTLAEKDKLADIFVNIGTLFFGSGVISYFIPGIDSPRALVVLFSLVASLAIWIAAVKTVKLTQ